MKRRRVLWAGAALAAGASGCVDRLLEDGGDGEDGNRSGDGDGDGGDDGDGDGGDDGDETSTGIRLLSSEFDVTDRVPGNAEDVADVSFDDAEGSVEVGGVIQGENSCKTAEMESMGYDDEADVLEVRVETADLPDAAEVCSPVIMELSYHATADLSGGLPSVVSVYHDGDLVVSVEGRNGD